MTTRIAGRFPPPPNGGGSQHPFTSGRQLGLFGRPFNDHLEVAYQNWRATRPDIYAAFVQVTREIVAEGIGRYGIKAIGEVVRYRIRVQRRDQSFAVNNNYLSRLARDLETDGIVHPGFFEYRTLLSERLQSTDAAPRQAAGRGAA